MNYSEPQKLVGMHWDVMKLLSLGVDEHFLGNSGISPDQARELLKGLLYLRERYGNARAIWMLNDDIMYRSLVQSLSVLGPSNADLIVRMLEEQA